jgi:hypothetical protein
MKKFSYRIPILYRVIFFFFSGFVLLGSFQIIDVGVSEEEWVKIASSVVFLYVLFLVFLSPYRNSYIAVSDKEIVIPSLFVPPFIAAKVKTSEIISIESCCNRNGMWNMTIKTYRRSFKVTSYCCYDKSPLITWATPAQYIEIEETVRKAVNLPD